LRGRRISWLAGGTLVLALVVVGWIDLVRTNDEVPPFAPGVDTLARYHRIQELDAAFDRRVWIYAVVAAAAMVLACAGADSRRRFSQAGVAGVVLGVAGFGLLALGSRGAVDPPLTALLLPSLTLLVIAAVGSAVERLRGTPRSPSDLPLKPVAYAALGCTAATLFLAYAYAHGQDPSCDFPSTDASWSGPVGWVAVVTAAAAFLLGLVGLAARRWVVALTCVVVNPAALVYMIASSGAFC
jgi:hypothetical protein